MSTIQPYVAAALATGLFTLTATAQDPDRASAQRDLAPIPATRSPETLAGANGPAAGAAQLGSLRVPIHGAAADGGTKYGVWAAGELYKASFHDGMTFVPYLGSDYPHNQSLSFRTTRATIGNVDLLGGQTAPEHAHTDYRYEYRYPAITEAYDVLSEGLEQTFVLPQIPATGDLVITGTIATGMIAEDVSAAQQAIVFADAQGRELVEYGRALAFDSLGNAAPVTTALRGDQLTLTLAADWLATATAPVVVDPLLTRSFIASGVSGQVVTSMDIGRDDEETTANVLLVYSRAVSAQDEDAFGRLSNDAFGAAALVFTDITSSWSTMNPTCAFVGGADRWVATFERQFASGRRMIRAHVRDKGDTSLLSTYRSFTPPADANDWRPDVGGVESYTTGTNALIVFQREHNGATNGDFAPTDYSEVHGVLFDPTNETFGTSFELVNTTYSDNERPNVTQVAAGGPSFSWVCAWQTYNNSVSSDDWDVVAKRIGHDGTLSNLMATPLAGANTHHQLGPVVEGNDGRYMLAFSSTATSGAPGKIDDIAGGEIRVMRFDWADGASSHGWRGDVNVVRSNGVRIWEATGLGFDTDDDSHFALGYRSVAPSGSGSAYCMRFGYNGRPTEGGNGQWLALFQTQTEESSPVACVFDNDHDDFLFAYGVDNGGSLPVYGHTMEYVTPNPVTTSGLACSNATLSWDGSQQIGAEFCGPRVQNAPPGAGHFLIVGLGAIDTPVLHPAVFPGCRLLVPASGPLYLGTMPFGFGSAVDWQMSLPEFLGPMNLYFQDWILDGNFFYSTHRLRVPIVR